MIRFIILFCSSCILCQCQELNLSVNIGQVFVQKISLKLLNWTDIGKKSVLNLVIFLFY